MHACVLTFNQLNFNLSYTILYMVILKCQYLSDSVFSDKYLSLYLAFILLKRLSSFKFATEFMKAGGFIISFQCPVIQQERMRLASLLFQSLGMCLIDGNVLNGYYYIFKSSEIWTLALQNCCYRILTG